MRTSRRRYLAAAAAALLGGCNESSPAETERTVTPVTVPQSAGDVLDAVEEVPVPPIPSATIVSDPHRRGLVEHVRDRIETARAELAAADGVALSDVDGLRDTETPFEAARERLREYRDDPGPRRFRGIKRSVGDAGTVIGHVRGATGDLDAEGVRDAVRTSRTRYTDLLEGVEYRLASPVVRYLPTVEAVEGALERAAYDGVTADRTASDLAAASPADLAAAWATVERLRLERRNAAGYVRTALDADAPPRGTGISEVAGRHTEALASLDVPRRVDGRPLPARVRNVLSSVRARRSDVLAAADPTDPETARRLQLLMDAVRIRSQLEAFGVAADATFPGLDEDEFPTERLPPEKRRAVDRIAAVAEAAPLQRHLGRLAVDMVTYGDRLEAGYGTDPVASAYFMYVAARSYANLALSRGKRVADALEAPDA